MSKLAKHLEKCIDHIDRNTCEHEDTYRGGAIWTICRGCGMKWADDEGGFMPYQEPKWLTAARAALHKAKDTDHE
jgi:hypothetical protein